MKTISALLALFTISSAHADVTCKTITFAQATGDLSMNDDYLAQIINQNCDPSKPFAVTQVMASMSQQLYPAGYKFCCQPLQSKKPAKK